MLFNLKSAFLFSLIAISAVAAPTSDLQPRATIPQNLHCDGKDWTHQQIVNSKAQARALEDHGKAYPKHFNNKDAKGNNIFGAQGQLWEFPLTDPVWDSGISPDGFRVIMKEDYTYVGVTNKDKGTGGTVHKC